MAGTLFDRAVERCRPAGARAIATVRGSCAAQTGRAGAIVPGPGGGGAGGRPGARPRRTGAHYGGGSWHSSIDRFAARGVPGEARISVGTEVRAGDAVSGRVELCRGPA